MPDAKVELLGVRFDPLTMTDTVSRCIALCRGPRKSNTVITINASHLSMMRRDRSLADACGSAELVVVDGMPVVWALRASGQSIPERVAGIDLMWRLLAEAGRAGLGVYFLGARLAVVETLVDRCRAEFPGLRIAGYSDGYFSPADDQVIVQRIRTSGAHILFVGMPSPFKEVWCERYRDSLQIPVILGVGGSFDVLAGYVRRAPLLFQQSGLEWFWRLLMEPRKLWKRYLFGNTEFILRACRDIVIKRLDRGPAQSI